MGENRVSVGRDAHQTPLYPLKGKPNAQEILNVLARTGVTLEQFKRELEEGLERKKGEKEA